MTAARAVAGVDRAAPRPVFCVIEHAHRNVAIAEDACAGRFTIAGETVDVGAEPDWVGAALPADREWRIEWTKFYYGLDLAHAYRETGDARFLEAWERLVRSYIRQVPPGEGVEDTSDVAARRVQNWIYAWAGFAAAPAFPGLTIGFARKLRTAIAQHAAYIRDNLTAERNHRTLELYALLIVGLALPDLDPDGALLELATGALHDNLLTDIRPDGVQREQSTHYHCIVLRSLLGARENARRFGLSLPAAYDEHLARACEFAMHCHRPDGTIPALSDSDGGGYGELLVLAADLLGREDLRWAGTGGREGTPPAARCVSFPDGGYFVQRSGWGDGARAFADERFLIFDCGPVGDGGHGHYDLLSIEAFADGRPLVLDPGRHTYEEQTPNLRHWFKGTAAHNTVVVDGLDQAPYRSGKPRKGTFPRSLLIERLSAPGIDVVRGEARSTCYEAVHTRRVAFVGDEYWIVEDRLAGREPHRYDLRFHLAPEAWGRVEIESRDGAYVVRAPGVALVVAGGAAPAIEAGWVAPEYGVRHRAPVISIVADGAARAAFTTMLMPLADGAEVPALRVTAGPGEAETTVEVAGPAFTDVVRWSDGGGPLELGPVRCRASAGWMRGDAEGPVIARAVGVGGGAVWAGWDRDRGMSAGREGEL